jgi:putative membrane protein
VQPLAQGWVGWGWDGSVLVTRMGWLTRTQHVVPHARVQSLALQQGPLLRKLRLASVAVHTTQALAVNAALHLDADAARALLFAEAERARSGKLDGLFSSAE